MTHNEFLLVLLTIYAFGTLQDANTSLTTNGRRWMNTKLASLLLTTITLVAFSPTGVAANDTGKPINSAYTDVDEKKCKTIKTYENASTQRCQGFQGYTLLAQYGDARESVDLISPDKKTHKLEFWSNVTSAFSSLGTKAEWRYRIKAGKKIPIALIVRLNAHEDATKPDKTVSYLVVSKITAKQACVVAKIAPSASANQKAREIADKSHSMKCVNTNQ